MIRGHDVSLSPTFVMTVRRETAERRVTCERSPCQSRFSRESRPSRLSQASAVAVEVFVNNAG
jgi:hypothetical protein